MITAINNGNMSAYKALFAEASDILSGYERVRTYDRLVSEYFKKDFEAAGTEEDPLFKPVDGITSQETFSEKLTENKILYKATGKGIADGFNPMVGITTLEEYFAWIKDLGQVDRKYTVLPLDEAYFEINANTRAIQIPDEFKKNGIAVQGDNLAEIVYFKIDRYFDYMDFNNTEIFIQWEIPKSGNAEAVKAVSKVYNMDIESEPGKLIFGWALSDEITKSAGNVKFSVRFFQTEEKDDGEKVLSYSFSTLTATCKILPGIGINPVSEDYQIDDCGDRITERLENSQIAGGYAAAKPKFFINLISNSDGYDFENKEKLYVEAYADDTGSIGYEWKRQNLDVNNSIEGQNITTLNGTVEFVPVDRTELASINANDPRSFYRKLDNDSYIAYTSFPISDEDLDNPQFELYTKQGVLDVNTYGVYWAVAKNRITNSISEDTSVKVEYPRPESVVITTQPVSKAILENGEVELSVINDNDSKNGAVTYQWQYDANKALNFGEAQPSWANAEGEATNNRYIATKEGHYKVVITSTRNGDFKSVDSDITRVTMTPQVPQIDLGNKEDREFEITALTDENCFKVYLEDNIYSDKYTVSWYLHETTSSEPDKLIVGNLPVEGLTISFNPLNYEERIIELAEDNHPDGRYYPIVTNTVNGRTESTEPITDIKKMFKVNS